MKKKTKVYVRCIIANKWLFHSLITFLISLLLFILLVATHSKDEFASRNILWFEIIVLAIAIVISLAVMALTNFGVETYENYISVYEYLLEFKELKNDYRRCVSKTYCENIGVALAEQDYKKSLVSD